MDDGTERVETFGEIAVKEALAPLVALHDAEGDYVNAESDDIEVLVDAVLEFFRIDRAELLAKYRDYGAQVIGQEIFGPIMPWIPPPKLDL